MKERFIDITFQTRYRSGDAYAKPREFYNQVLPCTKLYRRAVGFFSSTSFLEISYGILSLVKNDGKMQLITSPRLNEDDVAAIKKGYESRENIYLRAFAREMTLPKTINEQNRLNILANLIEMGILEIKIAVTKNPEFSMYHEKIGLFVDDDGNKVAISGSMNESETAISENFESFQVFCGWYEGDAERVKICEDDFNAMWQNKQNALEVFDFPELPTAFIQKYKNKSFSKSELIEKSFSINSDEDVEIEKALPPNIPTMPEWLQLHDYQNEAIENWQKQNYRGIFDMATGTGKTLTGLSALTRLFSDRFPEKLFAIIVCPYQHLVEQWVEDIVKFNIQPIIGYSSSPQKDWKTRLKKAILDMKLRPKDKRFSCLVITNVTFKSKFVQEQINNISADILLMIDEAHNAGAGNFKKYLDSRFIYRLALSATLDRHNDEEGTAFLHGYFENVCIHYDLERAIDEKKLTRYKYFPVLVYLTEDELDEYKHISREMSQHLRKNKSGKMVLDSYGEMLAIKRSRIVAGAQNKLDALREQIKAYKNQNNLLVYCGATTVIPENDKDELLNDFDKSEVGERQITAVTKILGNEMGMTVSKFTSEEDIETRKIITQKFKEEKIQAIVAIKCLDEGVNIPSIKTAFILASTTNPKEYIQRRGRVLRKFDGKDYAEIYDFVTLPRELASVQNYTKEELQGDSTLVKNELRRIKEFSHISMNEMTSLNLIDEIQTVYQISDKDLFENNSQEESINE
ncbi:DEAD/DEAH box helicase family protein [Treponema sp.]|uniref:DEAD/DEAH box helicase family protein n=1 Tax=Treponema sp. TaxID=166 RepID=UPI0025D99736|nr:DEAD/DEAH box helicase family protein [Treponema sp.]